MYEHITYEPNPYYKNQRDSMEPCPSCISIVGCEGDDCSVITTMTGTFYARYGALRCRFGIANSTGPLTWENHSGYLPCLVTSFEKHGVNVEISHFCNKVNIDGLDYSLLFTRVKKTNKSSTPVSLPAEPSPKLIPLTPSPGLISPGQTEIEDFVTPVDRFGKDIHWPSVEDLLNECGSWEENFQKMQQYWNNRLQCMVQFHKLPDMRLADAWRAGSIYQLIVRRGLLLAVGVNAYRDEFNHDIIGMLATIIESGDLTLARQILDANRKRIPAPLDYPDGDYKYPWPWALYLLKTGDTEFVRSNLEVIRTIMHESADDMTGPGGIMRESQATDSKGYWLVDNWSFLTGLAAYRVICERLGESHEAKWAERVYDHLFNACTRCLEELSSREGISYLPVSMLHPNRDEDLRSAGWATIMHMGRWPWEGFMLGARQHGIMLDRIDTTYDYGFNRLKGVLPPHTFGGFPEWCTSYNAGFAYGALRGSRYRSEGIRAYQFMIENAMSGPFSWWESIGPPDPNCPWQPGRHPSVGRGSSPHMWGDSFSRKILLNSLIAEFADGRVLIGRGIPLEWLDAGQEIEIDNVPLQNMRRFGYRLSAEESAITIELTGDTPAGDIILDLPSPLFSHIEVDGKEIPSCSSPITIPATSKKAVLIR